MQEEEKKKERSEDAERVEASDGLSQRRSGMEKRVDR